jgi:type VI protein secretion system component VasK
MLDGSYSYYQSSVNDFKTQIKAEENNIKKYDAARAYLTGEEEEEEEVSVSTAGSASAATGSHKGKGGSQKQQQELRFIIKY